MPPSALCIESSESHLTIWSGSRCGAGSAGSTHAKSLVPETKKLTLLSPHPPSSCARMCVHLFVCVFVSAHAEMKDSLSVPIAGAADFFIILHFANPACDDCGIVYLLIIPGILGCIVLSFYHLPCCQWGL